MFGKAPAGSAGAANKSGWMTKEIFSSYLKHLVTYTRCSLQYPCLLLLDNHVSHISLDNIKFTKANGIVLLTFPPHCSHKLQPLVCRSVFGPLKAAVNKVASNWMISNPGKCMKITTIPELVTMVYNQVFTVKNIQAGFKVSAKVKYPKSGHAQNWDRNLDSHKKLLLPISFVMMLMYSYSLYY